MRYISVFLILIILFICCNTELKSHPKVTNGIIDLTGYNFEKSGTIDLDGSWEFYWLKLYRSEDFKNNIIKPERYYEMPGPWNQENRFSDNSVFGSLGYATYRIVIKVNDPPDKKIKYGLKIKEMNCSYNLFINGGLVSSNGTVSDNPDLIKPQFLPVIIFFNSNNGLIEMILQISNYVDNKGGSLHSLTLGTENQIISMQEKNLVSELILFGVLIIMGLYHFLLYFIRKRDETLLFFGIVCLGIAIRVSLTGERFLYLLFNNLDWHLFVKIEHLTVYAIMFSLTLFIRTLYKKDISRLFVYIFLIITASLFFIVLFTPSIVFSKFVTFYVIGVIFPIFYLLYVLLKAYIKKRESALIMISGYFFLLLSALNDILSNLGIINSGNFLHIGMMVFVFSQSSVLSLIFNNTIDKISSLSNNLFSEQKKLEYKNVELDNTIADRVKIINSQKEEIENQIFMAENIQKSILPKEAPDLKGIKISFIYKPMMHIGGDFVDYLAKNDKEIGFFICDVSGHGVPGAFLSSMVKMELMNKWYDNVSSPEKVLTNIFNSISKNLGGNFITASALYLNIETGDFRIANAGHPSSYYLYGDREIQILKPRGKAIYEFFKPDYEVISLKIRTGSKIFIYTDGIIESFNSARKIYGENTLIEFLRNHSEMDVHDLCNAVLQEVVNFSGGEKELNDDVTMLAFEYKGI